MQDDSAIRVLDAVKALAFVGDLSMGQPTDHSMRTGWLAGRLAADGLAAAAVTTDQRRGLFAAFLRVIDER